ncbi:hypothetical protein [Desulfonema ishimotonii]|uniref:hypothetical protein n=1 Tax=Desulfonema ishimotonii TaxID=45657 RepID=UPI000F586FFE|nr:hypothetical protein [Desulfonema ishimotonii]
MTINLSSYSFEEWLDFIFYHPNDSSEWHFEDKWAYKCDSHLLIDYMTKLFMSSDKLLIKEYTPEDIDQGFWFITGTNGFMWALLDDDVQFEIRKRCIDSIKYLFSDLFSKYEIGTSGYMWWDSVFSYCTFKNKSIFSELEIFKAIFQTIKEIFVQNSEVSKKSSEHGIKHILNIAKSLDNKIVKNLILKEIERSGIKP